MKGFFKSRLVLTCVALVLLVGALAIAVVSNAHSHSALAYGSNDNWQIGFSGTAVAPGTGQGFGFWGWCAFSGVTSGTDGDCQMSQYFHSPSFRVTCEVSLDITSWDGSGGTFVINAATVTVHPSSQTQNCSTGFPADTGIPAAAGHYNFTSFFLLPGERGSLQIQVTQIP
jgi:hypothetical protein